MMRKSIGFAVIVSFLSCCLLSSGAVASRPLVSLKGVTSRTVDRLFTESQVALKPSSEFPPEDSAGSSAGNSAGNSSGENVLAAFTPVAPEIDREREPASAAGKRTKSAKAPKRSMASQGRLPSSVSDGFELRMRVGQQVSRVWVLKRNERFDLAFSNSTGSNFKASIPSEAFHYLHSTAQEIRAGKSEITRCPTSSIQLYVVQTGKPERLVDACVSSKSKSAEGLRMLSGLVATYVR